MRLTEGDTPDRHRGFARLRGPSAHAGSDEQGPQRLVPELPFVPRGKLASTLV